MLSDNFIRVIVVDDSEIWRELARIALERAGYLVTVLDSPFQLSAAMSAQQPHLVLCDLMMPGLRGDKLIEVARRNHASPCKFVLHSDRPDAELSQVARESGADGYIRKTGDAELLRTRVAALLAV